MERSPESALPLHTVVVQGNADSGEATGIYRQWTEQDMRACQRCPLCTASACAWPGLDRAGKPTTIYVCVVGVEGLVPPGLAPTLRLV